LAARWASRRGWGGRLGAVVGRGSGQVCGRRGLWRRASAGDAERRQREREPEQQRAERRAGPKRRRAAGGRRWAVALGGQSAGERARRARGHAAAGGGVELTCASGSAGDPSERRKGGGTTQHWWARWRVGAGVGPTVQGWSRARWNRSKRRASRSGYTAWFSSAVEAGSAQEPSGWCGAGSDAGEPEAEWRQSRTRERLRRELMRRDVGELASDEHGSWSGMVQAVQELACWRASVGAGAAGT
jgi:hypothetical protein